MAKGKQIQLVTCQVKIGGNRDAVTFRGPTSPVTYPEAILLSHVHGGGGGALAGDAVTDVKPALDENGKPRYVTRSSTEERQRLVEIYGEDTLNIFPGAARPINMPLTIADDKGAALGDVLADDEDEDVDEEGSPFADTPSSEEPAPQVRRKRG